MFFHRKDRHPTTTDGADAPMRNPDDAAPHVEVDEELSAAIVAYYSRGRSPFPKSDPDAVTAIARTRRPDELVAIIRALDVEMGQIPVDWAAMTYFEGCGVAIAEMTARHPELTADALSTLDWDYSYSMR